MTLRFFALSTIYLLLIIAALLVHLFPNANGWLVASLLLLVVFFVSWFLVEACDGD